MMTRTLAATAAVLPAEPVSDRRKLLTSAALASVVVATAALPAGAAEPHPDAALIALRDRLRAARMAFAAAQPPRSPQYVAALAALPSTDGVIDRDEVARIIRARCAALDEIEARLGPTPEFSAEAQAREDQAFEDDCEALDEIVAIPARSFVGLSIKAEVSTQEGNLHPELVASIMADILALGGAHA